MLSVSDTDLLNTTLHTLHTLMFDINGEKKCSWGLIMCTIHNLNPLIYMMRFNGKGNQMGLLRPSGMVLLFYNWFSEYWSSRVETTDFGKTEKIFFTLEHIQRQYILNCLGLVTMGGEKGSVSSVWVTKFENFRNVGKPSGNISENWKIRKSLKRSRNPIRKTSKKSGNLRKSCKESFLTFVTGHLVHKSNQ